MQLSDLVTLVGVIGGAGVTGIFQARTDLFGAYGIGLGVGFFGYFLVLLLLVGISQNFDWDWFLDGRRKQPAPPYGYPDQTQRPMGGAGGGHVSG